MTKYIGRLENIGLAKESSAGTALAPTFYPPFTSLTFNDKTTTHVEEEGLGRIEDSDSQHVTSKYGEGELEGELNDRDLGLILTSLLGASPTTTGGPTYTHAFTQNNTNSHQSLSIARQTPNGTKIFPYAVVNSLNISVEPEGVVTYTAGFMSRVGKDWSTLTPSYTTLGNKFLHQHLSFKTASSTAGLAAASGISLKKLDFTITANATLNNVTGTLEPESVHNHQFSVEASITLNSEDNTYRSLMLDGTYRAVEVFLNRASNSSLKFQMPRVSFSEWETDPALNDLVSQTISAKAHYDYANAVAMISTCELVNTYAGTNY